MWTTLWPEILVGIIVALLSGAATAGLGWLTYRHERKRKELAAIRRLIGELARRRSLEMTDSVSERPAAGPGHADYDAVTTSIFEVRKSIDEARVASRDVSDVHTVLDDMTASCNFYLRMSRRNPRRYVFQLASLRSELASGLTSLRTIHPTLPDGDLGSKAVRTA